MDGKKAYECVGYNFKDCNGHLLGRVGETYTLNEWDALGQQLNDIEGEKHND